MAKKTMHEEDTDIQDVMNEDGPSDDNGQGTADAKVSDSEPEVNDKAAGVAGQDKASGEWKDKYLRLSAEFDNYRKRTLKEKMEIAAAGGEEVIKSILPVLDDIDRALDAMVKTDDSVAIRSGIELIAHKLNDMLKAKGLMEIEAIGKELDTDFHEAVAKFQSEPQNKGKIIDVTQKGYTLKDKVIRHSKVVVGE